MKKNDAIVTDVSAEELGAAGQDTHEAGIDPKLAETRPPLERDKALAEIARKHEEMIGIEREEELDPGVSDGDKGGDDPGKNQDRAGAQGQPAGDTDPLAELGFYKNPKGELVTKIKVNGEEREVPASQFRQFIQKDLAGDLKLQQAFNKEQQLSQREQQLAERENQLRQTAAVKQKPSEEDAKTLREQIRAAFDKVYDGDVESATEALASVLLERGNATLTPEQLQPLVEQTVLSTTQKQEHAKQLQAWEKSVDEGNRELAKNHPEIYKDENLFALVNSATSRMLDLREKGDPDYINLMPAQIIAKAADEVTQWLGLKRGNETAGNDTRESRKANLKPIVAASGATKKPAAPQQKDMSPTAVIDRMKSGRATSIYRGA